MLELSGKSVSKGIAIGKISFFSNHSNIPKYEIQDTQKELERYRNALALAKNYLRSLYDKACQQVSKKESVIFQTHIMILEDSKFVETVEHYIVKQKLNAEFAVHSTASQLAEIFRQLDDDYLQQRYSDILDASNTLLRILHPQNENLPENNEPVIIAAAELLPSEVINFKKETLLGFVTNNGSKNSHTSILARTLELPAITHISEPLAKYNGMMAILDGQKGKIFIQPDINTLALYEARQKRYRREHLNLKRQFGLPSVTKNKQYIRLSAAIGSLEDISFAEDNDAEGVGIFRSESVFVNRKFPPSEEEQLEVYKTVVKSFSNSFVTICTANLGTGKGIGYLELPNEKNPAMGYKGIRVSLSNPELFKTQLRALYRASVYGRLRILLPTINNTDEVEYVRRMIKEVKSELQLQGISYVNNVPLGILIETPAAAMITDDLTELCDFVMIDTNALTQSTLAIDHENIKLEYFYEPYHKAVLRLIRFVCRQAHNHHKTVSVCGELASDTYITPLLLSLKTDELAVAPSKILSVKAAVRDTDTSECPRILQKL